MTAWKIIWKETTWLFLASRLAIFAIGGLSLVIQTMLHPKVQGLGLPAPATAHWGTSDPLTYLLVWWRWDAEHYIRIAVDGYMSYQKFVVFFPLWPLLVRIVGHGISLVIPGTIAYYLAGVLLANLCFYGALVLFSWLVWQTHGPKVARKAALFLALYPYTLFFVAGYTEALFLLLSLATCCFLQRGRRYDWLWACLCALLATTTRETGLVIVVPFLVLLTQRFWPLRRELVVHWRLLCAMVFPLALIPLGVLSYMFYLNLRLGQPLAFTQAAAHWDRPTAFPGTALFMALKDMVTLRGLYVFGYINLMDLVFTLLPLLALAIGWKRLPLYQSLYALFMVAFSLSTVDLVNQGKEPLASMPRYLLVIFPLFVLYALWGKNRWVYYGLIFVFSVLLAYNIFLFVGNGWVA